MRLFDLENNQVVLNKVWLMLIPEFAELIKRDKGSRGDYRGSKKLHATREFTFIYFDLDFTSPIREWPDDERRAEALRYAGLEEKDIDEPLLNARNKYDELLQKSARSLRTLRAVEKSLDQLDKYYETLDFTLKDRKGELLHDPSKYLMNLKRLSEGYNALDEFRKRVAEEMKGDPSIRGKATLGMNEGKRGEWDEGTSKPKSDTKMTDFRDIGVLLRGEDEEADELDDELDDEQKAEAVDDN